MELKEKDAFDKVNGLYLFDNKKITDHVPYEVFEKNFKAYSDTHKEEQSMGKSSAAKLSFEKYQIDRLMDGLAVISDDPEAEPMLLIDAEQTPFYLRCLL